MNATATQYSKEELEVMVRSNNAAVATEALLYLCFNINDPGWIQVKCVEAIHEHRDDDVRGLALTCIGHVARMHRVIDEALVTPVLLEKLNHKTLSGRAQDALDDIDIFIHR